MVSEGVSIQVGPGVQDDGRPMVGLDLHTAVVGRDGAGDLGKRFIVIPLHESALLVAVAEPSEEPANLCPVVSAPVWVAPGGGSMPTSVGSLMMLGVNRAQLRMALTPGPSGHRNICVIEITCTTHGEHGSDVRDPSALLLHHVSPGRIRVGMAPSAAI
jgi:hypothetical protein